MFCMTLFGLFCLFFSVNDGKSCFSIKKLTSERRAEHLFAGRNTQHSDPHWGLSLKWDDNCTISLSSFPGSDILFSNHHKVEVLLNKVLYHQLLFVNSVCITKSYYLTFCFPIYLSVMHHGFFYIKMLSHYFQKWNHYFFTSYSYQNRSKPI